MSMNEYILTLNHKLTIIIKKVKGRYAMKKYISIILCITIIASAFVACSGKNDKNKENEKVVATSQNVTEITTDTAKIKAADAINLISSYSEKELGLTEKDKIHCSFMVASNGEYLKEQDAHYIKVIAVIKEPHEDPKTKETTYTFDYKGEYYIRYDGKQILAKAPDSEEYKELKVKEVPTTEAHEDEADTTKAEKTEKK